MARSLLNANLAAAIADGVSLSISMARRGFSSAAQGRSRVAKAEEKVKMVMMKESADANSWVPDPVTGYYRPANRTADVDVAELREMLLTQKFRNH